MRPARNRSRTTIIVIEEIEVAVTFKPIRNLHLRVKAPDGAVVVSAPNRVPLAEVEAFVTSRLAWIRHHRTRVQASHQPSLRYVTGETIRLWGEPLRLEVIELPGRASVELLGETIHLRIPPGADLPARERALDRWRRELLGAELATMLAHWEPVIGVTTREWRLRRMRTRWGTCNTRAHRIWFNLELIGKPRPSIEYVVVHELVHLLEPSHNARFWGLVERFLPDWRTRRTTLNTGSGERSDLADV